MNYPPHLLDALGRVHAEAALDRLIRDEIALQAGLNDKPKENDTPPPVDAEKEVSLDGPAGGESSDNLNQPLPESIP
jgi:hypothetical protein